MKTTLAEVKHHGRLLVVYDDDVEINPYRVYYEYHDYNKYGYLTKRRKQIIRYNDMDSCMYLLWQLVSGRQSISEVK